VNEPHKKASHKKASRKKANFLQQPSPSTPHPLIVLPLTKKPLPPLKIMNYVCIVLTSGGTVALSPLLFWIKKGLTI